MKIENLSTIYYIRNDDSIVNIMRFVIAFFYDKSLDCIIITCWLDEQHLSPSAYANTMKKNPKRPDVLTR